MLKRLIVGFRAFRVFGANADLIADTSTQYDTVAMASAGGAADFDVDNSPTSPLPVATTATAFDAADERVARFGGGSPGRTRPRPGP